MKRLLECLWEWILAFLIILILAAQMFPCDLFWLCTWLFN